MTGRCGIAVGEGNLRRCWVEQGPVSGPWLGHPGAQVRQWAASALAQEPTHERPHNVKP